MLGLAPLAAGAATTATTTAAVAVNVNSPQPIGTVETLTTSVTYTNTAAGTTTLGSRGTVVFCDHTYETTLGKCGTRAQLGAVQITAAKTATLVVRLSPGSHSIYAKFVGLPGVTLADAAHPLAASDSSASLTAYSVTGGSYPLTNVLSYTGSAGAPPFTFTDTLVNTPGQSAPGTTTAAINDNTTGTSFGTVSFGATGSTFAFSPGAPYTPLYSSGVQGSRAMVRADFNRDGYPDLLNFAYNNAAYSLLTGTSTGVFSAAAPVSMTNGGIQAVVADFNNDGYPDVAYVTSSGTLVVLLNNQNGGFNAGVTLATNTTPGTNAITAGDFNGDGYIDIAIAGGKSQAANGYIQVFTNKGTAGTTLQASDFTAGTAFSSTNSSASYAPAPVNSLGALDIDGDGYADLFANSYQASGTTVYYQGSASGLVSGTANPVISGESGQPYSFAFADLKNDGVVDLLYPINSKYDYLISTCGAAGAVCSFAGAGATFAYGSSTGSPFPLTYNVSASGVTVADFDGNGTLDVAFGNSAGGVAVLSGAGSSVSTATGVLGIAAVYPVTGTAATAYVLDAADYTGNGLQGLAIASYSSTSPIPVEVLFPGNLTTSTTAISAVFPEYRTNVQSLASPTNYSAVNSEVVAVTSGVITASVALSSAPSTPVTSGPVSTSITITATLNATTISTNGHSPAGNFTFYQDGASIGTASASTGTNTLAYTPTVAGTHAYTVKYTDDTTNYNYPTTNPLASPSVFYRATAGASGIKIINAPNAAFTSGGNAGVIQVAEVDSAGNIVTSSNGIKLTLSGGTTTGGPYQTGTATGTSVPTPTYVNGVATFDLSTLPLVAYSTTQTYTLTYADVTTSSINAVSTITVSPAGIAFIVTNFTDPGTSPACLNQNYASATLDSNCTLRQAIANSLAPAATATATRSSGMIPSIAVKNNGFGYVSAPTVTVASPTSGTTATATAALNALGQVASITMTNVGSGYTSTPAVTLSAPTGNTNFTIGFNNSKAGGTWPQTINLGSTLTTITPSLSASATIAGPGVNNLFLSGATTAAPTTPASSIIRQGSTLATLNVSGMTLEYGSAGNGGGLYLYNAANIKDVTLSNNISSGSGGASYIYSGAPAGTIVNFNNCVFASNSQTATGSGGAAFGSGAVNGVTINFNNCTFTKNASSGLAGAITSQGVITASTYLNISNSTFTQNTANTSGGALNLGDSSGTATLTATLTNDTFYNNTAGLGNGTVEYGGAIYATAKSGYPTVLNMTDDTVVGNQDVSTGASSVSAGGVYLVNTVTSTINNSVIEANSVASSAVNADITYTSSATTFNTSLVNTSTSPTNTSYPSLASLGLSDLGSYGGAVQTLVPLPGSVLIKYGNGSNQGVVAADERGTPRPTTGTGNIDIGAVQTNPSLVFTASPASTTVGTLFSAQPAVTYTDSGYTINSTASPLTITLALDPGVLSGTASMTTTNGTVTFSGLYSNTAEMGTTLLATAGTGTNELTVASAPFNIVGPASMLVFGSKPITPITAGGSPGTVTALIEDSVGNVITSSAASVTLTVTGPSSFTTAVYTATAVSGVATFSPAALTMAGTYSYAITSTGVTSPAPAPEVVTAQLTVTGPATAIAGTNATYTVTYTDSNGNTIAGDTDTVKLSSTDSTATFSPVSAPLVNGVASFTVNFGTPGSQTITATDTSGAATAGTSSAIAVSMGSPTLTLSSSAAPTTFGSSVTFTATLSPYTAGTRTTNGETITFLNNGVAFGTGTLSAGMATLTTTALPAGTNMITAMFAADTEFNGATSGSFTETVMGDSLFIINAGGTVSSYSGTGTLQSTAVAGGGIGVAVDSTGYVWSIDSANAGNSVTKFTDTGAVSADYSPAAAGINGATALAIDGLGITWIANGDGTLSALSNAGAAVLGQTVASAAAISTPASLKVDSSGSLWISSQGDNSVVEVIGVAAPVTTPTVTAVTNGTLATRP